MTQAHTRTYIQGLQVYECNTKGVPPEDAGDRARGASGEGSEEFIFETAGGPHSKLRTSARQVTLNVAGEDGRVRGAAGGGEGNDDEKVLGYQVTPPTDLSLSLSLCLSE
jgi:hypothetical protein